MPADRRATFPTAKPVKTERTHEENQERAYIAASRRSDRSLEARIESARRASEIHKKRTGRALRVTEQDVVNEEMYEEEDDDLPTQYQRLNAHLQTSSWLFNRKLHDYIATQHGVRNMFLQQQFPGHQMQPFGQFQPNPGQVPMMNQTMLPPHAFNTAAQDFTQPSQPFSPQGFQHQQQGYRHTPYSIPQRPQPHQRAASISTSHVMADFAPAAQPNSTVTTPRGEVNRRMSLPPHAFEAAAQHTAEGQARPPLSRTSTAQSSQQQPISPQRALASTPSNSTPGHVTPKLKSEHTSPTSFHFGTFPFGTSSQVLDMNPLSMSLPPESQQLVGSALDPTDPRTSLFMSGSENLPQPFTGTYTYNPNLSPKSSRAGAATFSTMASGISTSGIAQTLAPEQSIKLDTTVDSAISTTPPSALSDNLYTPQPLFTPGFEFSSFFDHYQASDGNRNPGDVLSEPFEDNSFVNWDQ